MRLLPKRIRLFHNLSQLNWDSLYPKTQINIDYKFEVIYKNKENYSINVVAS